jgi:hypothetical protein
MLCSQVDKLGGVSHDAPGCQVKVSFAPLRFVRPKTQLSKCNAGKRPRQLGQDDL